MWIFRNETTEHGAQTTPQNAKSHVRSICRAHRHTNNNKHDYDSTSSADEIDNNNNNDDVLPRIKFYFYIFPNDSDSHSAFNNNYHIILFLFIFIIHTQSTGSAFLHFFLPLNLKFDLFFYSQNILVAIEFSNKKYSLKIVFTRSVFLWKNRQNNVLRFDETKFKLIRLTVRSRLAERPRLKRICFFFAFVAASDKWKTCTADWEWLWNATLRSYIHRYVKRVCVYVVACVSTALSCLNAKFRLSVLGRSVGDAHMNASATSINSGKNVRPTFLFIELFYGKFQSFPMSVAVDGGTCYLFPIACVCIGFRRLSILQRCNRSNPPCNYTWIQVNETKSFHRPTTTQCVSNAICWKSVSSLSLSLHRI